MGSTSSPLVGKMWVEQVRRGLKQYEVMARRRARDGNPVDIHDKNSMLSACAEAGPECLDTFKSLMLMYSQESCF